MVSLAGLWFCHHVAVCIVYQGRAIVLCCKSDDWTSIWTVHHNTQMIAMFCQLSTSPHWQTFAANMRLLFSLLQQ